MTHSIWKSPNDGCLYVVQRRRGRIVSIEHGPFTDDKPGQGEARRWCGILAELADERRQEALYS
jgi:hypothetical protein